MEQSSYQWWVYLVRCRDGSYYCGITTDLDKRIAQHNKGKGAKYTSGRYPVTLLWSRDFLSEGGARSFEYRVKKWGRIKKEKLIRGEIYIEE